MNGPGRGPRAAFAILSAMVFEVFHRLPLCSASQTRPQKGKPQANEMRGREEANFLDVLYSDQIPFPEGPSTTFA